MNIVIVGAGQVGGSLAESLVHEAHDVTLIDPVERALSGFQDRLDLRTVCGFGSYPAILQQAGADEADMLIAVSSSDEVNMVACQVAHSLYQVPTKIARIRSHHYFMRQELFGTGDLPVDVFIRPEQLVTQSIQQLITYRGALQVLDFAQGRVKLLAMKVEIGCCFLGQSVAELKASLPANAADVVAIFRNEQSLAVNGDTKIVFADEVFIITSTEYAAQVVMAWQRRVQPVRRVIIAGGGQIGGQLAIAIDEQCRVSVIEREPSRCEELAAQLKRAMVFCGDACDRQLLLSEGVEQADVFCALTNDDEDNIMACMQAKQLGAQQVMALITRRAYVDLIEGGPINIAISPQQAMVGSILRHVRQGDIVNVHSLRRGAAEAIEAVAHGDAIYSQVVGRRLDRLNLPKGARVGAVVRGESVLLPSDEIEIEAGDHVIVFVAERAMISDIERLFRLSPGFL